MDDKTYLAAGYLTFAVLPILGAAQDLRLPFAVAFAGLVVWWMVFSRDKRR